MFHSITDILQNSDSKTVSNEINQSETQSRTTPVQITPNPITSSMNFNPLPQTSIIPNTVTQSNSNALFQTTTQIQALQQQILLNSLVQNMLNQNISPEFNIPVLNELNFRTNRRKGGQIRFTAEQTNKLEDLFKTHKYLTPQQRKVISADLTLKTVD